MAKKKEKIEEEDSEEEESELEEEVEEEPEVDTQKLQSLLQTNVRTSSPVLEQVEVDQGPNFSLEQGLEQDTTFNKKEDDTKYETIKDPSQDYEDPSKRKQGSSGEFTPISASSHIDMASVGRQQERIGQEFHMTTPEELSHHPESARNYEAMQPNSSGKFEGEKTQFQEEMDKRYEIKK